MEGDGGNFHDAPYEVENRWNRYSEKKQQKRIIENPLHDRDPFRKIGLV